MIFNGATNITDPQVDIHGGGADLVFPHHENEIAQSEAAFGKKLAGCWLHNGLLNVNLEKMSKSENNSMSMEEFFKDNAPQDFRYYVLQHHYRSPIDFTPEKLTDAKQARQKLVELKKHLPPTNNSGLQAILNFSEERDSKNILTALLNALAKDLNTAKFLGLVFKDYELIRQNSPLCSIVVDIIENCLGVVLTPSKSKTDKVAAEVSEEIAALIAQRTKARAAKNWPLADEIRTKLANKGYVVSDEKKS